MAAICAVGLADCTYLPAAVGRKAPRRLGRRRCRTADPFSEALFEPPSSWQTFRSAQEKSGGSRIGPRGGSSSSHAAKGREALAGELRQVAGTGPPIIDGVAQDDAQLFFHRPSDSRPRARAADVLMKSSRLRIVMVAIGRSGPSSRARLSRSWNGLSNRFNVACVGLCRG